MTLPRGLTSICQSLTDKIEADRPPSVAIAAVRRGAIVWEEALGWADRERRIPASPEIVYPLASVSKSITATALMVLAERDLNDD